ncbi:hypothetical protein [Chitinilyticum litopenaei]|uniref:Uncharacterized protein n=2 Tax=Chitinilyticum piscinae TaxID=2866724 RepID=A0A8J7K7A5_9NEIS|nr:hypothetical protein [Chitinilyticum litopenaei]MBE9607738.1 hypothetical protein [Chitinilyticum piscinae]
MNWKNHSKIIITICIFSISFWCPMALAHTAVATVKNHATEAFGYAYNYPTQKLADENAVKACRSDALKNGVGHLAKQCKVDLRGKGPGYGAVTCGENGCGYVTGFDDSQAAIDAAYVLCNTYYTSCNTKNIKYWEDFVGFGR